MKKSVPVTVWSPFALLAAALLWGSGCRAVWPGLAYRDIERPARAAVPPQSEPAPQPSPEQQALAAHGEDLVAVLDQLQEIEAIDPQAKEELLNDLKSAKPDNWPLIVQQFQAALAYRQQLLAKEQTAEESEAEPVAQRQQPATARPPVSPLPKNGPDAPGTVSPTDLPQSAQKKVPPAVPPANAVVSGTMDNPLATAPTLVAEETPPASTQAPAAREATSVYLPKPDSTAAPVQSALAQQVSYVTPATPALESGAWQQHLETAIAQLERTTAAEPDCTAEVQQHLRLRLLRQLAGQAEQALVPTPGASPALQDYWSQQMFALTTFLDHQQLPDDKQRAASSLAYLEKARAKLAELAFLRVRNLSFVDSVDGFGMYQQRADTKFQPGQQVSLYCEVENFRSDSSPDGYRTLLATSYEVVDLNGQRVDGRDFPEVEDVCRNLRRDFHMQYGVNLPTRIYPGKYELRLVITDQLSHKIGQTSIPLEIVED